MALALVAIAVVGALLIVPQLAHAAGAGSSGSASGAPALTAKQLSEKWVGHPVPEVPEAELLAIYRRTHQLMLAPPPPGGSEHKVYDFVVYPQDTPGQLTGSIFVRQKAAERDEDLGPMRQNTARAAAGEIWLPRFGETRRLMHVDLVAQRDWGFLGTGFSGGQLGGIVGGGLGTLLGGPAGGAVGSGLGSRL